MGQKSTGKKGGKKHGRNQVKCQRYRTRVGKPRGPGQPGNKTGKGWRQT